MTHTRLQFKRVFAGYYQVIRLSDGAHIADIESGEQAELYDRREWLVTFRKPSFLEPGEWDSWDAVIAQTYREGKTMARDYAESIAAVEIGSSDKCP
jgi:hypothetical protein